MNKDDSNSDEYSIIPLQNLTSNSEIWSNYCKLMKNGEIQNPENVFCIKCLEEQGIQKTFACTSSVNEVRDHLVSVHQMAQFLQENDTMEISTSTVTNIDDAPMEEYLDPSPELSSNISGKGSAVWRYFDQCFDEKENKEYIYCNLCLKSEKIQKYQSSTATTNLMKHLKRHHNQELAKKENDTDLKRTFIKTSNVWKYFCNLTKDGKIIDDTHVYCGKCLEQKVNKKYRTTTSTGSLKRHLKLCHNITVGSSDGDAGDDTMRNEPRNKPSNSRIYFYKLESEPDYVYCLFCLTQNRYQRYCISTSTSALKAHLISKHDHHPDLHEYPTQIHEITASLDSGIFNFPEISSTDDQIIAEIVKESDYIIEDLNDSMIEYVVEEEEDVGEEFEVLEIAPNVTETPKKEIKTEEKHCRACGKSPGCFTKLSTKFEDEETPETTIGALYSDVVGVETKEMSPMSALICYECEAKLKLAFKFKQMALRTEQMMIERMECDENFEKFTEEEELLDESSLNLIEEALSESNLSMTKEKHEEEMEITENIVAIPVHTLNQKACEPKKETIFIASHVEEDNDESDTELEYCEKRFDVQEKIQEIEKCEKCEIRVETYDSLLTHNETTHGHKFPYKAVCRKRFASQQEFDSHNKFMHEKINCEKCSVDFVNHDQFQQHLILHTQNMIGTHLSKCVECNVFFMNETSLILHLNEHNRVYACHHCTAKFRENKELNAHMSRRHKFTCELCGASYATLQSLEIHERSHTGARPFKCEMCEKSLISKDSLKVHMKYVHKAYGNTDQICKICKKIFTSKNGLLRHSRMHSGDFIKCTLAQCGKKFTSNFNLKKHIELVHNDLRAYVCTECPKRYKSNAHLRKHVETEHLKLRFVCPLCEKMITNRWDFNYHVKKIHPDKLGTKAIVISNKDNKVKQE